MTGQLVRSRVLGSLAQCRFPKLLKAPRMSSLQMELSACKSNAERMSKLFRIARVLVAEGIGALSMVPYGYRALQLYRSLPPYGSSSLNCRLSPMIAKDVRYSSPPRTLMDIYIPHVPHDPPKDCAQPESRSSTAKQSCMHPDTGFPVAVFCHGGVWATGEKWHYAPMATRLAQCGILTCVVSYTLYPQAKARAMVAELSQALTWTLDNIGRYGGDPKQVSALGHSAGAHMWAMVLLERARAAGRPATQTTLDGSQEALGRPDVRMPARFIGMAGVYDIAQHLEYEAGRGVRHLSTMERALGGEAEFAGQSPSVILAHAAGGSCEDSSEGRAAASRQAELLGRRVAEESTLAGSGVALAPSAATASSVRVQEQQESFCSAYEELDFHAGDAKRLPPCLLYSSKADLTVPWIQSCLMKQVLQACHVPVQHKCFEDARVSHASFVADWKPIVADEHSISEQHQGGSNGRPGTQDGEELKNKQGVPAFLEVILSDLHGHGFAC